MEMRLHLLIYAAFLLSLTSCTDLEEELVGEVTESLSVEYDGPVCDCGTLEPIAFAYVALRNSGTAFHGGYFSLQELTSDEMVVPVRGGEWYDGGQLIQLHQHTYDPSNFVVHNTFMRHYQSIYEMNELLNDRPYGFSAGNIAEVRALRAYLYWRLLDMFGRVKILTEESTDPPQVSRQEVFDFVEGELLEVLGVVELGPDIDFGGSALPESGSAHQMNRYGALGILAKLYINAEVYTGTPMYDKAEIAASYIIDSGYYQLCGEGCAVQNLGKRNGVDSDPELLEGYAAVFAPNNDNNPEHVFSINYDEHLGPGMNFSHMSLHNGSQQSWRLESQPWNGYATLEEFYNAYDDKDVRKKVSFLAGPQLDFGGSAIIDYAVQEDDLQLNYTPQINELAPNARRQAGARPAKFSFKLFGKPDMDNDFPIVRLGEMYLIRAEAKARQTGNWQDAEPDVNVLRARAGVEEYNGNLNEEEFLAERGREMFQEAIRRTDLIRFGRYNNPWWEKSASAPFRNLFPIPESPLSPDASSWTQNPGY
ncbi:MAG TPA: RagB/SusD family nutrient uptake outer membrane protein [Phaeodactylibacter sp.]|nr:RagB/SusD family nutrient uptake outer membrane protein [Phaeodactylibacter sp.]